MRFLPAAVLVVVLSVGVNAADQKDKKDDPSQIGDRDVAKCLNF